MKLNTTDILKFNLHLGKWKKLNVHDSQYYFFNRFIFKSEDITVSILKITIFLNLIFKSKNRLLFLGGNPYTTELIENLAISNQQFFMKPWGYGLYTNRKLYKQEIKKSNFFFNFKTSTAIVVDPTNLDLYFKEMESFKIPTLSFYNAKSTYFIKNSFITFNTVYFYINFLKKFIKSKKNNINFYESKFQKLRLLKKFKRFKSKKKILLNKIRLIRVKNIRKKWFKPFWKLKNLKFYVKKPQKKKIYTKKR